MERMSIEPWLEGRPGEGKVFAAVFPHSDDFTFFALGLMAKLLREGYRGYFIRMTDDCMDSFGLSYGETALRIERETQALAGLLGIEKVYDFNYNNHYMDHGQLTEMRHRLIMLFRHLKVDTVISFDPYGHYEENPDHQITGMAVEQASWMAGRQLDLPESKDMGLAPHFVLERYYTARGPQEANCLIDITPALELKKEAIRLHATPLDNMWKVYLEKNGQEKPLSYEDFVRTCFTDQAQEPCQGLTHYEKFRHVVTALY
ncbi:MAG: PIG-L deacetylase family protein [Candidatus Limiplasma sp.]|nr:PIG-L deacetylase family protein [Candidatus Limiplasma sp.]